VIKPYLDHFIAKIIPLEFPLKQIIRNQTISSCLIYINKKAIVIAGKTKPTKGTKMEGK
jgi:hypothetical protein